MVLRAVFVGVNKHRDTTIDELTGATKDATALWALFMDNVPDMHGIRLLDEEATGDAIRGALDGSLGAATAKDTVIVFFAGHGTPGHQLVPFDTRRIDIAQTTIPMQEIADRLKATRARASVVILDCCFSGGAPARVLDGLPTPRSAQVQIRDLGGEGRIVLAAAGDNEEALEFGQHGLFTAAMLRVLQDGPGWTDVGLLMEEVTRQVRAEASRSGHQQTPTWAGHIQGGIELPPLQRGPIFAAEFPETAGIQVGRSISDLAAFGIPQAILDAWSVRFDQLNELQLSAVNNYRVLDGQALLIVAPTTSGKTFVGEMTAARAIANSSKAVFLLPFKALANEKFEEFDELYGQALGLRILRCTGDYTDQTEPFAKGQYDIALLTYEMFLGLSVAMPNLLSKVGTVVLDEAQFVIDPTRGIVVELLLTNLIAARERGIEPQLVALSAVIGNVNHFDEWLGCQTLITNDRPVPLVEGVLDRNGTFQFLDVDGLEHTEQLLESCDIVQRRDRPSSQDVIVPLVRKLVGEGEQALIFRNKKGSASGCANYLAKALLLAPATDALTALPEQDLSTSSEKLRQALLGGVGFHTSDLSREERVVVERSFRCPESAIRAMVATSTVAAGVNTPVETVVIVETEFPGPSPEPYTVAVYKNMAGRAGRLGLANRGRSILLADSGVHREQLFAKYVCGRPGSLASSFDRAEFDTWALRLLAQVKELPRGSVVTLLTNTYAGYLETRTSSRWENQLRADLDQLLQRLIELGLVEEEVGLARLSLLGRACGRSHLKLRSALRLIELLRLDTVGVLTAETLLALIHALPEFDEAYTPMYRRSQREAEWQRHVTQHFGSDVTRALQFGAQDPMTYHARCKRIAVLLAWIDGVPISEIEDTFTVNSYAAPVAAGNIRHFNEFARFHLAAAFEIADVLALGHGPGAEDVEQLLIQLEVGIPAGAVELLQLPVSLGRGTYLALHRAGLIRPTDVYELPEERLQQIVGATAAAVIEAARPSGSLPGSQ